MGVKSSRSQRSNMTYEPNFASMITSQFSNTKNQPLFM